VPHIAELRRRLDLSPNIRPNQVLTKAICQIVPGGNDLIEWKVERVWNIEGPHSKLL
jgi:hypothetical protein